MNPTPLHAIWDSGREPEHIVAFSENVRTFADFTRDVAALSQNLRLRPGTRFLLACDSSYAFAVGLFGLWQAGKRPILPANTQPGTLTQLAATSDGLVSDGAGGIPVFGHGPASASPTSLPADTGLELWTSGTTGAPKSIAKSLHQLDAEVAALEQGFGAALGPVTVLAGVPHHHIYGLLFRLLWPLAAGRPFLDATSLHPEELALHGARHAPVVLVSSPAQLKRLPGAMDLAGLRGRLRAVFSSGGPLPASTAAAWAEALGAAPIEVFGSTETGGVAWRRQDDANRTGRWRLLPGVRAETDATGALVVHSPFLPDDQPFSMGDAVTFDTEGRFSLLGRLDRIVKVEEKRLSLHELEQRLCTLPEVRDAGATVLHGRRSEVAVAVVLTAGAAAELALGGKAMLNARLRAGLAPYFDAVLLPRRFRYVEALPYSERGKLSQAALAALFATAAVSEEHPA